MRICVFHAVPGFPRVYSSGHRFRKRHVRFEFMIVLSHGCIVQAEGFAPKPGISVCVSASVISPAAIGAELNRYRVAVADLDVLQEALRIGLMNSGGYAVVVRFFTGRQYHQPAPQDTITRAS